MVSKTTFLSAVLLGISFLMPSMSRSMEGSSNNDPEVLSKLAKAIKPASGVQKVNDNLYIGKRAQDTDLHFAMTRLTKDNFPLWENFAEGQKAACLRIWNEYAPNEYESVSKETQAFLQLINITRPSSRSLKEDL